MNTQVVVLAALCGLGAVAWFIAQTLIEEGITELVRRRFPRLRQWWGSKNGVAVRLSVLLIFFAVPTLLFSLPALGLAFSEQAQPALWIIVLPVGAMTVWTALELYRVRVEIRQDDGHRSDDGTWSAG